MQTASRFLFLALLLIFLTSCASTGRVGPSRYFDVEKDLVWLAALDAVQAMDARIKVENRTSGIIAASMVVDSLGGAVDLNISVSSSLSGADVQISAVDRHASETDLSREEDLRYLEEQFLDLVDQAVMSLRRRGSGRRPY